MQRPNGITVCGDGTHLFVADADHVRVIPLDGGSPWRLNVPDSINVTGIDGLAFADDALIAHHTLSFWRVVRYDLDRAHRNVTGRTLYEANTPDTRTSTTGEVVNGEYVFIGNGQINRMNAGTIDAVTMEPIRMYRIRLRPEADGRVVVALSGTDSVAVFDAQSLDRIATLQVGRARTRWSPRRMAAARTSRTR